MSLVGKSALRSVSVIDVTDIESWEAPFDGNIKTRRSIARMCIDLLIGSTRVNGRTIFSLLNQQNKDHVNYAKHLSKT